MTVSGTPGTGSVTLSSASSGYQTFAAAGGVDGDTFRYLFTDTGNAWEVGMATYTASGTSVTRSLSASSTGTLLSLTSAAIMSVIDAGEDIAANQGDWTALTFGSTGTIFGAAGTYISDQTFSLGAGQMLEIDGYVHKALSANGLLGVSVDGGSTGYVVFVGNDGNYAINYYASSNYNNIVSTGGSSPQNWAGHHKLMPTIVCVGSSDNRIYCLFDGMLSGIHADVNVQMEGTVTIYLVTDSVAGCSYRARVITGGMFTP
jgi:hypothetical protein